MTTPASSAPTRRPRKPLAYDPIHVRRILAVYKQASTSEHLAGTRWYGDAHSWCLGMANVTGRSVATCAGVLAATSQRQSWVANVAMAGEALRSGKLTRGLKLVRRKVMRILHGGEPEHVLSGRKILAFYGAIIGRKLSVVIDRHAFDITEGGVTDDKARKALDRVGEYNRRAAAYCEAAARAGIDAIAMQAITWVTWRNLKAHGAV